jgi:hypothetical protein
MNDVILEMVNAAPGCKMGGREEVTLFFARAEL